MAGIEPDYFLDEMSQDEIAAVMKAKNESHRSELEQTRLICFYTVVSQTGTEKFKTPQDLITFPWEKEDEGESNKAKPLSKEEVIKKYNSSKLSSDKPKELETVL